MIVEGLQKVQPGAAAQVAKPAPAVAKAAPLKLAARRLQALGFEVAEIHKRKLPL